MQMLWLYNALLSQNTLHNINTNLVHFCFVFLEECLKLFVSLIQNWQVLGVVYPTPVLFPGKSHGGRAWWTAVHGVAKSWTWLSDFTFTFHFYALEKEMATHSSVLAWRIPGMGLHRVGHYWNDLAAAVAGVLLVWFSSIINCKLSVLFLFWSVHCEMIVFSFFSWTL